MMLWFIIGAEALIILLILIKMLSKRGSFFNDEEDQSSTPDTSMLNEALSPEERWEEDGKERTE